MFIVPGLIDKKWGAFYSDIFTLRQKGDYADFIEFDGHELNTLIPEAREFLLLIDSLLAWRIHFLSFFISTLSW